MTHETGHGIPVMTIQEVVLALMPDKFGIVTARHIIPAVILRKGIIRMMLPQLLLNHLGINITLVLMDRLPQGNHIIGQMLPVLIPGGTIMIGNETMNHLVIS